MNGLEIRPARLADAAALADLSTQLGYPSSPGATAARLARLLHTAQTAQTAPPAPQSPVAAAADHLVLVAATSAGQVVGWVHLGTTVTLESEPFVELFGLVVDQALRGRKIGERLVLSGLEWAAARGFDQVRVRSNVVRADAHRFYERLGFKVVKTQKVFSRPAK
ncbi:MAG TPA: GNAT family N-acetyltransferase [Thermoanaerobaculia bacterium]|nr:GNAT family N-acetyltransferase [Thermoanaerobaculia bacterium]